MSWTAKPAKIKLGETNQDIAISGNFNGSSFMIEFVSGESGDDDALTIVSVNCVKADGSLVPLAPGPVLDPQLVGFVLQPITREIVVVLSGAPSDKTSQFVTTY